LIARKARSYSRVQRIRRSGLARDRTLITRKARRYGKVQQIRRNGLSPRSMFDHAVQWNRMTANFV
jgi:hypothetical protein